MRRRFRYTLFWFLIFAAASSLAVKKVRFSELETAESGKIPPTAVPRTVFVLKKDGGWTTFRIPSNANRLSLLSLADLRGDEASLVDREFPYQIRYRFERLNGETVSEGTFALRANVIPMVDAAGHPEPAAFFGGRKAVISTSRTSTLELTPGEILILRLQLQSSHPTIFEVSVRAFQIREVDQDRPAYLWNRIKQESLDQIAERRVHSLVDISPDEKLSILRNRPFPLGAFGVAGKDFSQETLYIRNDLIPAHRELIEPLGVGEIRCTPNRRAVVGIPRPGGRIRLGISLSSGSEKSGSPTIELKYFGETIYQRETFQLGIDSASNEFSQVLKPGTLEISSPVELTIRPYFQPENETERPLEIDPALIRVWRIGKGESLTFSRSGQKRNSGFLRLSARPVESASGTIHYTLLDRAGSAIGTGSRKIDARSSLYDVELTQEAELPVNEPEEVVLELSPDVAAVRLESDSLILLNGYSRPSNLVHRTRVPADYVRALPDPDRIPIWFGLHPDQAEDLIRMHRSHLLQVQDRPPEDDAEILAGKYQWQDYQPLNGVGQYLLIERDPESPARVEALPSLFAPLSPGEPALVIPENPPGLEQPGRRLAFEREGRESRELTLYIDGLPFFHRRLVTSCGEIPLPPLPENFHTAHVVSEASRLNCFLNYIKPDTATKLKRRAQRVSPGIVLEYQCEKVTAEEELLTGMIFAAEGAAVESEVTVSIQPGEKGAFLPESDSFTTRNRSYVISSNPTGSTPVLGGSISRVDAGRRFFIPFGRDMGPGIYVVTITYGDGPGGYLTLSKVLSGEYTEARFFRETSR